MFSEVSFRKGMVFYNFADFWTGFVFLVKTVMGLLVGTEQHILPFIRE